MNIYTLQTAKNFYQIKGEGFVYPFIVFFISIRLYRNINKYTGNITSCFNKYILFIQLQRLKKYRLFFSSA